MVLTQQQEPKVSKPAVKSAKKTKISEESYVEFISPYSDAISNMEVRINALNKDYRKNFKNYPIHNTQCRIKKKDSIEEKLIRQNKKVTIKNARDNLTDIAGIRIICYFVEDVYSVVELLKKQADLIIIKERDYIKEPKPSGYQSYHIVFGVPVYYINGMEYYPVEIQLRTMSMDFWASMEHRVCYKKDLCNENASKEFLTYAKQLNVMEENMKQLLDK